MSACAESCLKALTPTPPQTNPRRDARRYRGGSSREERAQGRAGAKRAGGRSGLLDGISSIQGLVHRGGCRATGETQRWLCRRGARPRSTSELDARRDGGGDGPKWGPTPVERSGAARPHRILSLLTRPNRPVPDQAISPRLAPAGLKACAWLAAPPCACKG